MSVNKFKKAFEQTKNQGTSEINEKKERIQIGGGLLSGISEAARSKEMDIIYVLPADIYPSEDNLISMNQNEIEDLAQSIVEVGILNPPILRKDGEKYRIVCGERRYRAVLLNIEKGLRDSEQLLKCHLFNPEIIDLPLSDEEKEDFVRDVENAQQRNKTDADKLMLIRKFKERYEKLRVLDPERFKGIKTRDLLENDLNMSKSAIAQFQKIENQGSEKLKQAILDNQINITAAVDVASMEDAEQEELIENILGNPDTKQITKKDISAYQYNQRNAAKSADKNIENEESFITEKSLKKEMKTIFKYLREVEGVQLEKEELFSLLNKIRDIEFILKK